MKTLRTVLLIGLATVTLTAARAADKPAITNDLAQLQGEWSMVSGTADGQDMPEEMRKQAKRVCKGDETTTTVGEQLILKAKITLDQTKKPRTIDYDMIDGFTKGKKQFGIYELDGDTFKSCFAASGNERPTDFSSKPGDHRTLTVWKREKKVATPPEQK